MAVKIPIYKANHICEFYDSTVPAIILKPEVKGWLDENMKNWKYDIISFTPVFNRKIVFSFECDEDEVAFKLRWL